MWRWGCWMRRVSFSFFLDKKRNKKIKEKRMLRLFSGPTHKESDNLRVVYEFVMIVENFAACYKQTLEALLFRLLF
jgi:hypothetical protein